MNSLRRRKRWTRVAPVLVAVAALTATTVGETFATFTSTTSNTGNLVTAATDFRAPSVSASVIMRSGGTVPGYLKQGGAYYVYAQVAADTGNPASGIATVTTNVANVTTGSTAVSMVTTGGPWTVGGSSYNYRTASQTANGTLSEGSKSYTVTATDNASNAATLSGLSVTVDNTAPSASDQQTANVGSTAGKLQLSDTLTLTFSEPTDPDTIVSGWGGASTNVVVRMTNGGLLGLGTDDVQIRNAASSAALPLGRVDLKDAGYMGGLSCLLGGETVDFGASGTASTMSMSGSQITITLGTPASTACLLTATGTTATLWTPDATPTDRAGNVMSSTARTETGGLDVEF